MAKILVIDDEITIRMLFEYSLQEAGYEVKTASSGIEALKIIEEFIPDFMIVDIIMPEMSGWDFIQKLKSLQIKNPNLKNIPYIVITGENFLSSYKSFAFENDKNFKGYFEKMTPIEKILEVIKNYV